MSRSSKMGVIGVALLSGALLGNGGCSSKEQDCLALGGIIGAVRPTLDFTEGAGELTTEHVARLGVLLDAAASARPLLAKLQASDKELRVGLTQYNQALALLAERTKEVKTLLAEERSNIERLAEGTLIKAREDAALRDLMPALTDRELQSVGARFAGIGGDYGSDSSAVLEKMAATFEGMRFVRAEANRHAAAVVRAMRKRVDFLDKNKDLEEKTTSIVQRSKVSRTAFVEARDAFIRADELLVRTCTPSQ